MGLLNRFRLAVVFAWLKKQRKMAEVESIRFVFYGVLLLFASYTIKEMPKDSLEKLYTYLGVHIDRWLDLAAFWAFMNALMLFHKDKKDRSQTIDILKSQTRSVEREFKNAWQRLDALEAKVDNLNSTMLGLMGQITVLKEIISINGTAGAKQNSRGSKIRDEQDTGLV